MARIWSSGFELQSLTSGVEFSTVNSPANGSINTSIVHGGSASFLVDNSGVGFSIYVQHQFTTLDTARKFFRTYIYVAQKPSTTAQIMLIQTSAGNSRVAIRMTNTGALQLYDAGFLSQMGSNSSALSLNTWYRIEIDFNPTSGAATGYIDGVSFATGTIAAAGTTADTLRVGMITATVGKIYFDDIAVNDTSGSFQTGLPGDGRIVHLRPNATGDNNQFTTQVGGTAGSTNNYTRVNETTPDDITSYNSDNTVSHFDDFNIDNTPAAIGSSDNINVVCVGVRYTGASSLSEAGFKVYAKKTSGGSINSSPEITPNLTSWTTNANSNPKTYPLTLYQDFDSNNWTKATLDTALIGYNISTGNTNADRISTVWMLVDYTPVTETTTSTTTSSSSSSSSSTSSTSTSSTSSSSSTSSTSTSSTSSSSSSSSSSSTSISTTSSSISTTSTSSSTSISTTSISTTSSSSSISTTSTSSSISTTSTSISTSSTSSSSSSSTSSTSSSISTSSTSSSTSSTSISTTSTSSSSTSSTSSSTSSTSSSSISTTSTSTSSTSSSTSTTMTGTSTSTTSSSSSSSSSISTTSTSISTTSHSTSTTSTSTTLYPLCGNLLNNPSFETSSSWTKGGTTTGVTFPNTDISPFDGTSVVKLDETGGFCYLYQDITVNPGQTIQFSAYCRITSISTLHGPWLTVKSTDFSTQYANSSELTSITGGWTRLNCSLTVAPTVHTLRFILDQNNFVGVAYFDAAMVEVSGSLGAFCPALTTTSTTSSSSSSTSVTSTSTTSTTIFILPPKRPKIDFHL